MAEFASLRSYWHFAQSVKRKARFVHDEEVREFLKLVLETSASRRKTVPKDQILFRAQRGFTWKTENRGEDDEFDVEAAYPPERMRPSAQYVGDGRVNPRGIPCLYMASNLNTAMAEVRPWLGSRVSLAQFKVMRDSLVVDCSQDKTRSILLEFGREATKLDAAAKEAGVWGDIAYALSEPVMLDEPHSEYVPTQVLAEAFRSQGYDGIVYKSLLDERGKNIALFDVQAAELINCCLYETKAVSFEFEQADNPYFIVKHYPEIAGSIATDEPPAKEAESA